jgi:hypothetical protein
VGYLRLVNTSTASFFVTSSGDVTASSSTFDLTTTVSDLTQNWQTIGQQPLSSTQTINYIGSTTGTGYYIDVTGYWLDR